MKPSSLSPVLGVTRARALHCEICGGFVSGTNQGYKSEGK